MATDTHFPMSDDLDGLIRGEISPAEMARRTQAARAAFPNSDPVRMPPDHFCSAFTPEQQARLREVFRLLIEQADRC